MHMNRRQFLGTTISAGLTAATGMGFSGCGGITRADLPRSTAGPTTAAPLDERRREILRYASLAPSGHNTQPWIVRPESLNQWIIMADPERLLPAVDPENKETLLSLGAFAENLSLAAGALGLSAEIEVLASSAHDPEVMRVHLKEATPTDYPLERLEKRMTVKQGHLDRELSAADIKALSQPLGGLLHYFPRGTDHARCIAEGAVETFRRQSRRDAAQEELAAWLRLSKAAARRHRDGLTTAGMAITGLKGWFVRHFVSPSDFMKESFREQGVEQTARLASQGGGWIVISGSGRTPADIIDSGRRFERMALMARERHIALHPMTQWLEEKWGLDKLAANHSTGMIPRFVLRAGYLAGYPEPVSLRRPVDWFLHL